MRYFIEVTYNGRGYSGFQTQKNANTIQAEVEKALLTLFKADINLTGSSRTDAGVHALQNYFHFDYHEEINNNQVYNLNAILPGSITIKAIRKVKADAHCRFDAVSRTYNYFIYQKKDPFLSDRAYYFPYTLDTEKLNAAAALLIGNLDFTSFSKKNTQVKTFICEIMESQWTFKGDQLIYSVKANRFLRGMVRALTATMLKTGRGKLDLNSFKNIIEAKDASLANFAVPAQGLFLMKVEYPANYFE